MKRRKRSLIAGIALLKVQLALRAHKGDPPVPMRVQVLDGRVHPAEIISQHRRAAVIRRDRRDVVETLQRRGVPFGAIS